MAIIGRSNGIGIPLEELKKMIINNGKLMDDDSFCKTEETLTKDSEASTTIYRNFVSNPELDIKMLSKSFPVPGGKVEAFADINLIINPGEFVCLVGPSGCGKSTLLNIIAGLDKPDCGEVNNGTPNPKSARNRLLIFQEASLFPWLTVFQNVAYGLKIKKIPKERYGPLVDKYLALVQLAGFKDAFIHQLSGGMKQRVALARALVLEPEMLLMDEPFAALDVQTRKDMYRLLLEIWQKTGKTILFITHNVDEALILSNRILVMTSHPGRIKKEFQLNMLHPRSLEQFELMELRKEIMEEFANG